MRRIKTCLMIGLTIVLIMLSGFENVQATDSQTENTAIALSITQITDKINLGTFTINDKDHYQEFDLGALELKQMTSGNSEWTLSVRADAFHEQDGTLEFAENSLVMHRPTIVTNLSGGTGTPTITSIERQSIIDNPYTILTSGTGVGTGEFLVDLGKLVFALPYEKGQLLINPLKSSQGLPTKYESTITWTINAVPGNNDKETQIALPTEKDKNGCYVIRTVYHLQAAKYDLDGCYILGNDIDASYTETWNDEKGFEPIGTKQIPFTGFLDGQGFAIRGLTMKRQDEMNTGMFASKNAVFENLIFENAHVEGSAIFDSNIVQTTSLLASHLYDSQVTNVLVKDSSITGSGYVGVIFSFAENSKLDAIHVTNVRVKGNYIAGDNSGGIMFFSFAENSKVDTIRATNSMILKSSFSEAGLVGSDAENTEFTDISVANSEVDATDAGGVIAMVNGGSINHVVLNDVRLKGEVAGGVVSRSGSSGRTLIQNVETKLVNVEARVDAGSIGGNLYTITIRDVDVSQGNVSSESAGGIIGTANSANLYNADVKDTTIYGKTYSGGLIAESFGTDIGMSNLKNVKMSGFQSGGVVGKGLNTKIDSVTGEELEVMAIKTPPLGLGFAGGIAGTLDNTYLIGTVVQNNKIKGLVQSPIVASGIIGQSTDVSMTDNHFEGRIEAERYANGIARLAGSKNITAIRNSCLCDIYTKGRAGLYGFGNGTHTGKDVVISIRDTYFRGTIETNENQTDIYASGLLYAYNTPQYYKVDIQNAYASFSFKNSHSNHVPFVHTQPTATVVVTNSYYNGDTLPNNMKSSYGIKKTEAQMKNRSTYQGFDFGTVWSMQTDVNNGMPYLQTN